MGAYKRGAYKRGAYKRGAYKWEPTKWEPTKVSLQKGALSSTRIEQFAINERNQLMKKLFAILICFAMMAGGPIGAAAQSMTDNGTYDIAVKGNYTPTVGDVLSVTLEWEAMSFTYTAADDASWNPFEHEYGAPKTASWDTAKKKITVTNHSSTEIEADVAFAKTDGVDIVGTFYSKNGDNFTALTSADSKKPLDTAVGTTPQNAPKLDYYFGVSGGEIDQSQKLGSITVRISLSLNKSIAKIKNDIITAYRAGVRDITVDLPSEHPDFYKAIYDALAELDYSFCNDTINLTINGAKTIPNDFVKITYYSDWPDDPNVALFILGSISLPDAETIGSNAFRGCPNISSVSLPNVKTIGENAFFESNITSINLPKAELIGYGAFMYNTSLQSVNLPFVTSVGGSAFAYCDQLHTVNFGKPITSWGNSVFAYSYEQTEFTPNITLTLSAEQMAFEKDFYGWTLQSYNVEAGAGKSFCGYTFLNIEFAQ